jgi:hypothetical protein
MFTYETLGQPSMQSHPPVNTLGVTYGGAPYYLPVWETPYCIPPPYSLAPYMRSTYMPYTYTTSVD